LIGRSELARLVPFVAIVAAAAYLYVLAGRLEFDSAPGRLGPDVWPKGILVLTIVTCLVGVIKAFVARKSEGAETVFPVLPETAEDSLEAIEPHGPTWLHLALLGIAVLAGYVLIIDFVGFLVANAVMITAFLYVGRYRNHLVIGCSSVLGTLLFFYVFRKIAYISLPLGKGPFLSFSVFISNVMGIH